MNMTTILNLRTIHFFTISALLVAVTAAGRAQTTASWIGGASDVSWTTAANWDIGVPAQGTNAMIGSGSIVDYSSPMVAGSFAGVNNSGTLIINAGGFNIDALGTLPAYTGNASSLLQVNSGGSFLATTSTAITLTTGSAVDVEGGVLIITNSTGNIIFGVNGNNNGAGFTNNGGTVVFSQPFQSKGRYSRFEMHGGALTLLGGGGIFESSNDQERKFLIDGGTANLGDFSIARTLNSVGSAGLVISNGTVNLTSLRVGTGVAASGVTVYGGTLTNTGTFTISDRNNAATSGERRVRFYVRGGTVVSTAPSGIVAANQANNSNTGGASVWGAVLDINSGLIVAEKLTLVGPDALTNAYATLTLASPGAIYLGSGGLVGNVGYSNTSYTMTLGGTLGAKDDYSIVGNGTLSGTFAVNAADLANSPHNITNTGVWSGGGSLVKTGGGMLILLANNTYSGATTVSGGTLALGAGGSISNSTSINVGSGAVLDVSAVSGAALLGSQSLNGSGTVAGPIAALSGSTLRPGGLLSAGTLTLSSGLTEAGGVNNSLELSDDPTGTIHVNDLLNIVGDLNLSGINPIQITSLGGSFSSGAAYKLIQYSGSFNGGLTNFSLTGASGVLSNDASGKAIYLVIQSVVRPPAGVVWLGNPAANYWDTMTSSNWLSGAGRDIFVPGDSARFDDAGAANPIVTVFGSVTPAALIVDTASNYTFNGGGSIDGSGGLLKTNSGTLTILTTNGYPGATLIGGGTVEAVSLANGGSASSLGLASSDVANLQFWGSTLRYLGPTVAIDRAATLNGAGATIDVASNTTTLTLNGSLTGPGALIKAGPGVLSLAVANTQTGGTVVSNGVLRFGTAAALPAGTGLTNSGGTVVLAVNNVWGNVVNVNGNAVFDLNGTTGNLGLSGAWSGAGTITISNQGSGSIFTMGGNGDGGGRLLDFTGSVVMASSAGMLRFNNGGGSGTGPNYGSTNISFDLGDTTATLASRNQNLTIDLGGLAGGSGTSVTGPLNGDGTVTWSVGARNLPTVFAGIIKDNTAARRSALTKVGTNILTLSGVNTYTGPTVISNGVLALSGSGSIAATPSIEILAGAALDVADGSDGALVLAPGQTLLGEGAVSGKLTISSDATLSVGPSAGGISKLTVFGALSLQPGGTLQMDVDHFSGTNDVIDGLVGVTYGGTLSLGIMSADLTSRFKLFNAGSYSGVFDSITPVSPGWGWVWDTSSLAIDGTLKVKALTAAQPKIAFAVAGSELTLSGVGGPPGFNYTVLASSDLSLPLASWTSVGTGSFKGDGSFVLNLPMGSNGPMQFYTVQYTAQ